MGNPKDGNVVAAFSEEQTERLTGITRRQLRYWARDFYAPGLAVDSADLADLKLYSFRDLVCLKVLNSLRNDARIPLQELRRTKDRLRHLGHDLWAKVTLYVLGKRVVFDNPETGALEEAVSGQGVLRIPLHIAVDEMSDAVRKLRQRREATVGKIERKRRVAQNQPVIAGTGIPVRSIQAFSKAGYGVADILRQYPTLAIADVEAAMRYEDVA